MKYSESEIETIVDGIVDDVIEITLTTCFTRLNDIEYAIEYLKSKIEDLDPVTFLE